MSINIDLKELSVRESERVEWKENGDDIDVCKSIAKTVSAFANDISNLGGGYVICGATEGKDVHGFPKVHYHGLKAEKLAEIQGKVLQYCRDYVSPSIIPIVDELKNPNDDATRVLVFTVLASPEIHSYRDPKSTGQNYYVRIGKETREAKNGLLTQLLIKKNKVEYFDKRANNQATVADIDIFVLRDYLQEMGLLFLDKAPEDYFSDKNQIADLVPPLFVKSGLDNELRPRNFTLLMFGKKESITRLFPEAYSVFSIYGGVDRSDTTAERHLLTGNIVDQARRAIELLNAQSFTSFDKTSGNPNQEKYPLRALQEAVVNAIVHRDYQLPEPNRITVFIDRIEVNSAGPLHWGVDKEKFRAGKASAKWRNQSFAYLFNKLQLAQSEGQGIPTIIRTMKEEGCPNPIFEIENENIICILPAHPRHQMIRDIQNIQDDIILAKYPAAKNKLEEILAIDPYNYRCLDLYCEVLNRMNATSDLHTFILNKKVDLYTINSNTLINIADTLQHAGGESIELASNVITIALSGRIEQNSILKAIITLQKLGDPETVIRTVSESLNKYPDLRNNGLLFEKRAQARMDIAKKSIQAARDKNSLPRTKARAEEMTRELLEAAERDLAFALENSKSETERLYVERDLNLLEKMKNAAQ